MEEQSSTLGNISRADLVKKFRRNAKDVGSPEVQIALVTQRIESLAGHMAKNDQDKHSRRGLLTLVSRRKKLLSYLKTESVERYRTTLDALGLRK